MSIATKEKPSVPFSKVDSQIGHLVKLYKSRMPDLLDTDYEKVLVTCQDLHSIGSALVQKALERNKRSGEHKYKICGYPRRKITVKEISANPYGIDNEIKDVLKMATSIRRVLTHIAYIDYVCTLIDKRDNVGVKVSHEVSKNLALIVEGVSDMQKLVKVFPQAVYLVTNGSVFNDSTSNHVDSLLRAGLDVFILTDPDTAGDNLASIITKRFPHIKRIEVSEQEATKDANCSKGVEHCSYLYLSRTITKYVLDYRGQETDMQGRIVKKKKPAKLIKEVDVKSMTDDDLQSKTHQLSSSTWESVEKLITLEDTEKIGKLARAINRDALRAIRCGDEYTLRTGIKILPPVGKLSRVRNAPRSAGSRKALDKFYTETLRHLINLSYETTCLSSLAYYTKRIDYVIKKLDDLRDK